MRTRTARAAAVAVALASTAALTWATAHRFYVQRYASSELQIFTSTNLPLHAWSPTVVRTERIINPTTGSRTHWKMDVAFERHGATISQRSARAALDLTEDSRDGKPVDLRNRSVFLLYVAPPSLQGKEGYLSRIQLELYDINNKVMRGPLQPMILTDRMMPLEFRPYTDVPIPLGFMQNGFDLAHVHAIGIRLRVSEFADRQVPVFYPAKGTIVLSPIFIASNKVEDGRGLLSALGWSTPSPPPVRMFEKEFFAGFNYPWFHYGSDYGHNPWSTDPDAHDGISAHTTEVAADFARLRAHGVRVIRLFVFCDLRTGLLYDEQKNLIGFDRFVHPDMRAVLEIARAEKVSLILSLFDFHLLDGIDFNGSGEHQELVTNPQVQTDFIEKGLEPLFTLMAEYTDVIFAVETMNEPEQASFLTSHENFAKLRSFLERVALTSRKILPNIPVTLGSANRQLLKRFWSDFPSDIQQFHSYRTTEDEEDLPFDFPADAIAGGRPVLIGEVQGDDVYHRLTQSQKNGYAGVLFWSLRGNDHFTADLQEIRHWIQDNRPADLERAVDTPAILR